MKQTDLFGNYVKNEDEKYTTKVKSPVYKPLNKCPNILELLNDSKSKKLIRDIKKSDISETEKIFLIEAAKRHHVFNYSKIADYYAHSNKEMQDLMERSALIIIDFNKAIQYGYVKLSNDIVNQYLSDYENDE